MMGADVQAVRRVPGLGDAARWAVVLLGAIVIGAALVPVFDGAGVSIKLGVAGGIGLIGFTLLTLRSYDSAVGIGFALMAVVLIEPSPPDAIFAIIIAVSVVTGRFTLRHAPVSAVLAIGLLAALNVASVVDAISISAALRFFMITGYLLVFSLWLTSYAQGERQIRVIVRAWLAVALFSALIGVAAYLAPIPFHDTLVAYDGTRVKGLFKDPNVFGPFLIPIAMIVLDQQIRPRVLHLRRMAGLACFGLLALGVLFSFSRAAWMNMAIATTVTLLANAAARRGGRHAVRLLMGLMLTGALVAGVLGASGSVGFLQQRAKVQSYDTNRFAAQHAGYELGWSHPVGVGPGNFGYHHSIETHSTYVRVLSEQGFGGLAAWLAILIGTLVLGVRNIVLGRDTFGIGAAALVGSWCGLIFNSVVVDTLHWRHLWVVAALIWVGATRRRGERRA